TRVALPGPLCGRPVALAGSARSAGLVPQAGETGAAIGEDASAARGSGQGSAHGAGTETVRFAACGLAAADAKPQAARPVVDSSNSQFPPKRRTAGIALPRRPSSASHGE